MRHRAWGHWPGGCTSGQVWLRSLAAYTAAMAMVAALAVHGFALFLDALVTDQALIGTQAEASAPREPAVPSASTRLVEARVLGYRDFKETLRSERFWQGLRSGQNPGRSRDDNLRWSPRPNQSSGADAWDDEESDGEDQATTYRTVCVRLCDGYYWPISFATSPEYFARDAAVCERSCSASARLFVYRNPGEQPEQMMDLAGRRYVRLETAFRYRTTYDEGCLCRPQAWARESLDRHRMYALQAERRKGNRAAAKELASLQAKLPTAPEPSAAPVQRRSEARDGEPIMRLGAEPSPAARGRRSRSSPAGDDDWMRRAFGR